MHFRVTVASPLIAAMLGCCAIPAHADSLQLVPDGSGQELPDLPGASNATPWGFNLAEKQAALGYDTPIEKWRAQVDHDIGLHPALSIDYARKLTNNFGAGGAYTRQNEYSEIILNGVYAPRRNLRLRITGAQLRTSPGYLGSNGILQNSYLFSARKYWNPDSFFSSAGVTAYTVEANMTAASMTALDDPEIGNLGEMRSGNLAPGKLNGYAFNMRLRPSPLSSIELRREMSQLAYHLDAGKREDNLASNRIAFSQRFDNCTRFQGGFSADDNADRFDLNLTRDNWNLKLSREQNGGTNANSVQIAYALPLDGKRSAPVVCASKPEPAPSFERLVDAAVSRPAQFPREPLAIVDQ